MAAERVAASCSSTLCNFNINGSRSRQQSSVSASRRLGLPSRYSQFFGTLRLSAPTSSKLSLSRLRTRRNVSVFAMAADGIYFSSVNSISLFYSFVIVISLFYKQIRLSTRSLLNEMEVYDAILLFFFF